MFFAAFDPRQIFVLLWCDRPLDPRRSRSTYPPIALSGVLSSWDIVARNSLFARFASSAA